MTLTYFPVVANYGAFPQGSSVNGTALFTPNLTVGQAALVTDVTPPLGEISAPSQGSITNGTLQVAPNVPTPLLLLANTSDLNLESPLQYTVSFQVQVGTQTVPMPGFVFNAVTPRAVTDGAMSSTSSPTHLTSATANFTGADVGAGVTVVGAAAGGANLMSTIASVTSSTVAVLADPAQTTVSGATVSIAQALDLITVTPAAYNTAVGVATVSSTGISDATPIGRQMLTAANAAAVITLLGLGGGQDTYLGTSSSQSAMLALTGPEGAWTIRTDTTPNTVWYLTGTPASSLSSWTELPASGGATVPGAGMVKSTGTALATATAGTDFVAPGGALGTPSSGTLTNCTFPTLNQNTTGTAANVTGTVAIGNGGTGQTGQQAAINALTGTQSAGKYLRSDGTNAALAAIQAADVPTLNQSTTGNAATATKLTTARNIAGASFDGSANIALLNRTLQTGSTYTAAANDLVACNPSGAMTVTLPTAPTNGTLVGIKNLSLFVITYQCGGSDVFNVASGSTSGTLIAQKQGVLFAYDSSSSVWTAVADDLPPSTVMLNSNIGKAAPTLWHDAQTGGPNMLMGSSFTAINEPTAFSNIGYGGGWRPGVPTTGNLSSITTGYDNTAIGAGVMNSATTAHSTVGVGADVLSACTTGPYNTAVGAQSQQGVTTGQQNVSMGWDSLTTATTASYCTALGTQSLQNATTSQYNTAVGVYSLLASTTGGSNTAVGANSLAAATDGTQNVAVGYRAVVGTVHGQNLVGIGYAALAATPGNGCVGVGAVALNVSTGAQNAAVGFSALGQATSGNDDTSLGYFAGYNIITGSQNTILGALAGYTDGTTTTTDVSNATLIGYDAQATTSNVMVFGSALSAERPSFCFGTVGAAAALGGGAGVMAIAPAITNPTSNPTGATLLYVDASTNDLKVRTPGGTVANLTAFSNPTGNMDALHTYLSATFDPAVATTTGALTTAGVIFLMKVPWTETAPVTNIATYVFTAGSTLTSGQCFAGIYDSSGNKLAATADQSGTWNAAGGKTMALSGGPVSITGGGAGGFVYVALLFNGTTGPTLFKAPSGNSAFLNVGLAAGSYRAASISTGQTSLPSTLTLSGMSSISNLWWVALQ